MSTTSSIISSEIPKGSVKQEETDEEVTNKKEKISEKVSFMT